MADRRTELVNRVRQEHGIAVHKVEPSLDHATYRPVDGRGHLHHVPGDTEGEFRRKVRISSGNFQNLFFFKGMLLRFWRPLAFCFWSHKVFRWFTPFFLMISLFSSALLALYQP